MSTDWKMFWCEGYKLLQNSKGTWPDQFERWHYHKILETNNCDIDFWTWKPIWNHRFFFYGWIWIIRGFYTSESPGDFRIWYIVVIIIITIITDPICIRYFVIFSGVLFSIFSLFPNFFFYQVLVFIGILAAVGPRFHLNPRITHQNYGRAFIFLSSTRCAPLSNPTFFSDATMSTNNKHFRRRHHYYSYPFVVL